MNQLNKHLHVFRAARRGRLNADRRAKKANGGWYGVAVAHPIPAVGQTVADPAWTNTNFVDDDDDDDDDAKMESGMAGGERRDTATVAIAAMHAFHGTHWHHPVHARVPQTSYDMR